MGHSCAVPAETASGISCSPNPTDIVKNTRNSDVAMYFAAKLGPALLGFLSIFLIAKSLSPERYGKYSLALTLILLTAQLFGSWLNQAQFFFLPKRRDQPGGIKAWFEQINFCVALIGAAVVMILLHVLDIGDSTALVGGMVFFAQIYWNHLSTFYQSSEEPKVQLIATTYQVAMQIAIILTLYLFHCITVVTALMAVFLGFSAGIFLYIKRKSSNTTVNWYVPMKRDKFFRYLKLAFGYGGPFSLWFLFCQIYTFSDRFLLSWAGFNADVGRYSAARDLLLGVASMFAMPLLMVAHPMIMRIWTDRKDTNEIAEIINRNLTIIFIVGVLFCTLLFAYGPNIFAVFFSAKYQLRDYQYAMIGCAIFFSVGSMYAHKALEVTGATGRMAMLGGAVAVFSLLSNLLVINRFGLSSVIVVALLSQIAYFSGAVYMSRKLWRIFVPLERVFTMILAAGFMYFVSRLTDMYFPAPMYILAPLSWGFLVAIILSVLVLFAFPEVNGIFLTSRPKNTNKVPLTERP